MTDPTRPPHSPELGQVDDDGPQPLTDDEIAYWTKWYKLRPPFQHGFEARLLATVEQVRKERDAALAAILDIDAHASPFGADEDGFISGGYIISIGCLHRALGVVGRSAGKRRGHAVQLDYAHGPDCEGCQKLRDITFDAIASARADSVRKFRADAIRRAQATGDSDG